MASATELVLRPKVRHEPPDSTMENTERYQLLYHWSEVNHESMIVDATDLEMWLNLDWSEPIIKIPTSMISRLMIIPSGVSSPPSLLALKFRVWVRLVDAEDPWKKTALASAFDEIDVAIGGSPLPGSCEFVPNNQTLQPSVIALETPVRVQCHDWIDPMLSIMDPGTEMAYCTTVLLRRAQSSHCSATSTGDPMIDEFESDDVIVPRHRFTSAVEAEALLPYGCWTVYAEVRSEHSGLASLGLLAEALSVQLPDERHSFPSDVEYFRFALEREISASSEHSISRITSAIVNVLDAVSSASDQEPGMEEISHPITTALDILKEQSSQDLEENQQILDVVSAVLRFHRRHKSISHSVDALSGSVALVDQALRDRQHLQLVDEVLDEPRHQRLLNMQTILGLLDQWLHSADMASSCHRRQDVISRLSRAVNVLGGISATTTTLWQDSSAAHSYDFFQSITFVDHLGTDIDESMTFSRLNNGGDAWLAGGLTTSDNDVPSGTITTTRPALSFITVSLRSDQVRACFLGPSTSSQRRSEIESEAVLTVKEMVVVDPKSETAKPPAHQSDAFNRITLVMK